MKKILIVDDDESIIEALKNALEMENYLVKTALDGREIFTVVEGFKPDLIILDVLLTGEDGQEVCQNLKTGKNTKHIPIIMTSAQQMSKKTTTACGADDFIAKPFAISKLLAKIKSNLR